MGERVGIDAAQLEPQRCRLQDIALGGGEARCPNEVRIAGTVDENIRSIGDAARLVLHDDMADAIALHHAVRTPAMIEKRHPDFEQKALRGELQNLEHGRASCRERVRQNGEIPEDAVTFKKITITPNTYTTQQPTT